MTPPSSSKPPPSEQRPDAISDNATSSPGTPAGFHLSTPLLAKVDSKSGAPSPVPSTQMSPSTPISYMKQKGKKAPMPGTADTTPSSPVTPMRRTLPVDRRRQHHERESLAHSVVRPTPLEPSKCPLFACFYSEFDNIVGPKVCFQAPAGFMDRDIAITPDQVHDILRTVFSESSANQPLSRSHSMGTEIMGVLCLGAGDRKIDQNHDVLDGNKRHHCSEEEDLALPPFVPTSDAADYEEEALPSGVEFQPSLSESSIFDSTSEYIITGNELADGIICLSTHGMHILTRPTIISDSRYERNSLLFSVGFVIRKEEDPRPFHPLLSKIASALHSMELESRFLSKQQTRVKLQRILEAILFALNSRQAEANLLLDDANHINLKLFKPPKPLAPIVADHVVPVLLRPEWQLHMFDWDLTVNWIVPHIDGLKCTKTISQSSEVDMEMVKACLRVLKHHQVISFVDIFRYSNVYESTPLASAMLAGRASKLLNLAFHFTAKTSTKERLVHQASSPSVGLDLSGHSAQNFAALGGRIDNIRDNSNGASARPSSVHERHGLSSPHISFAAAAASSFPPRSSSLARMASGSSQDQLAAQRREHRMVKAALAQLYCACTRGTTFGEVLISKLSKSYAPGSKVNTGGCEDTHTLRGGAEMSRSEGPSIEEGGSNDSQLYQGKVETHRSCHHQRRLQQAIDWKEVLNLFDHRRFVTFGVIYGLIRRIHVFPMSYSLMDEDSLNGGEAGDSSKANFPPVDLTQAFSVASAMDGTTCDDALSCIYDRPLTDLIQLVRSTRKMDVMLIESIATKDLDK